MNSYQRRQRDIAYYKQCVSELESMLKAIVQANPGCRIPLGNGLAGNDFITPYNTGEFERDLSLLKESGRLGERIKAFRDA
jgi:hypothetical protein